MQDKTMQMNLTQQRNLNTVSEPSGTKAKSGTDEACELLK